MKKNSTASPAGKKCAKCKESLGQYAVTTKDGKMYHQSCFACAKCQEPMTGPYVEVPPAPALGPKGLLPVSSSAEPSRLCEPCYARVGKSLCALCEKVIIAGGLVALGERYHTDHFVCTTCFTPLTEGYFEYHGKPYCRIHKAQMVGLVCVDCKGVITQGTYVTALESKHWHTSCFKCSRCSVSLNEYFEKGDQVMCGKCSGMGTLGKRKEETKVDTVQLERDYAAWTRTSEIKAWPTNAPGASTSLLSTESGWPTELGSYEAEFPFALTRESLNVERRFYKKYLANQGTYHYAPQRRLGAATLNYHRNFCCFSDPPVVISVESKTNKIDGSLYLYRTLVRTHKGDDRLLVPISSKKPSKKKLFEYLKTLYPELSVSDVVENSTPELVANLLAFEEKQLQRNFKFGVLYCRPGQKTEDEMYANVCGSPAFEEFLEFLGTKIELAQWSGYSGGLGTKDTSTGTFSIFTKVLNKFDIMFHVSTYIPFHGADAQQVERKRHLGNDVGLIIFKDGGSGDDGFDPLTISSHFNHVFIVVQKVPNASPTSYRVSIVHKPGVRPHTPFLPFPATFQKGEDFRNFLLAKLINGGLAALHSPEFLSSLRRTRKELLAEVMKKQSPRPALRASRGEKP